MIRSPFLMFIFGALAGVCLMGVLSARLLDHEVADFTARMEADRQGFEDSEAVLKSQLADCYEKTAAQDREMETRATGEKYLNEGWYTLLYDPTSPGNDITIGLLDSVKPGLGALLAHVQAPPGGTPWDHDRLYLHWVFEGRVKPLLVPPGSHAIVTRDPAALQRNMQ